MTGKFVIVLHAAKISGLSLQLTGSNAASPIEKFPRSICIFCLVYLHILDTHRKTPCYLEAFTLSVGVRGFPPQPRTAKPLLRWTVRLLGLCKNFPNLF